MRLCVNGHWTNDVCRCLEFWQGDSCDLRDCGPYGTLNITNGQCECTDGYTGEFCQYDVCLHKHEWYCNDTRSHSDSAWSQERQLCPVGIVENLLIRSFDNFSSFQCDCAYGSLVLSNITCLCQPGYYGEFCQWNLCPTGELWNESNQSCDPSLSFNTNTNLTQPKTYLGFFGYDINLEFTVAASTCLSIIFLFLIAGRLALKFVKQPSKEPKPCPYKVKRKTTLDQYFDLFHRPNPELLNLRELPFWKRILKGGFKKTGRMSTGNSRKTTTHSAGAVLEVNDISPVSATVPYRGRPRSASTQLETVFEVHEPAKNQVPPSAPKDQDEIDDDIQDKKFRESLFNFARQISSDMSVDSSRT